MEYIVPQESTYLLRHSHFFYLGLDEVMHFEIILKNNIIEMKAKIITHLSIIHGIELWIQ